MRFNCTTEYLRRKHLLENLEPIKRQRICHLRVMHWQTKLKNFLQIGDYTLQEKFQRKLENYRD